MKIFLRDLGHLGVDIVRIGVITIIAVSWITVEVVSQELLRTKAEVNKVIIVIVRTNWNMAKKIAKNIGCFDVTESEGLFKIAQISQQLH